VYKAVVSKGLEVQEIRFANSVEQGSSADLITILYPVKFPKFLLYQTLSYNIHDRTLKANCT